jgi:hypothetical protein
MRIRRGLLFWGLFLIPLGAVPLLVRAGAVDAASLAGAWRLWPVILIALGLALVAGRSQVAVVGTAVTAIILGIAAGGALASGNNWLALLGDCSARSSNAAASIDQSGSFVSPATVRLGLNCGDILLSTQQGTDWTFRADFSGPPPLVNGYADRLEINSSSGGGGRHQAWDLKLPSLGLGAIDLTANAGSGTLDLTGTTLDSLTAKINAFNLSVDASDATLKQLDIGMNAGRTRITLGAGSMTGKLSVNAGAIDLCVPAGAQLRIRLTDSITFAHNLDDRGLVQDGETWTRSGGNLNSTIELTVSGAAASFTLDPDGGCQ